MYGGISSQRSKLGTSVMSSSAAPSQRLKFESKEARQEERKLDQIAAEA